jgi:hypothetical protein
MTEGIVTGGWGFVTAAYALTALVFLIYGISLFARLRDSRRNAK